MIYALAREGLLPRPLTRMTARPARHVRAALALGAAWAIALAIQFLFGVPIETSIQLSSGNFLLTYVLIILTAWRLLSVPALAAHAGHLVAGDPRARGGRDSRACGTRWRSRRSSRS